MITAINDYIKTLNITEKNSLEFMLEDNNYYSNLIKRYICSQLKISLHLKGILQVLGYKGPSYEPLDQIINNRNPFLWEEILKYDNKSNFYKLTNDDIFYQIISKSDIIYDIEFIKKQKLDSLRLKLDSLSSYKIISKKVIKSKIKKLIHEIEKGKREINHFEDLDESKQKQWKNFVKETINQIKENVKDISNLSISQYMVDKIVIDSHLETLKKDIVLNFKLIEYIYSNKDKNQTLREIINELISIFENYGIDVEKIKYRDFNYSEKTKRKIFKNTSDYIKIEEELNGLDEKYEKIKNIADNDLYVKEIINIFQEFMRIYPYNLNNGRISRYLFNALLLKKCIIPPPLYENHSKRYQIDRLSDEYILGNRELLNDYIFDKIKKFNQLDSIDKEIEKEEKLIKTK